MEKKTVTLYDRDSRPMASVTSTPDAAGWDWFIVGQNVAGREPTLLGAVERIKKELGREVYAPLDVAGIVGREARQGAA